MLIASKFMCFGTEYHYAVYAVHNLEAFSCMNVCDFSLPGPNWTNFQRLQCRCRGDSVPLGVSGRMFSCNSVCDWLNPWSKPSDLNEPNFQGVLGGFSNGFGPDKNGATPPPPPPHFVDIFGG